VVLSRQLAFECWNWPALWSPHSQDHERIFIGTVRCPIRPALGDGLDFGPEFEAFGAILIGVAKGAALPAAKTVIGHRYRDRYIDSNHADINPAGKLAGGVPVAGKNADTVAILMRAWQTDRFLEIPGADDLQHRAEDFFLVAFHFGGDMVDQRRADKEALFVTLQTEAAAVDDDRTAFGLGRVDPLFDLRLGATRPAADRYWPTNLLLRPPEPVATGYE